MRHFTGVYYQDLSQLNTGGTREDQSKHSIWEWLDQSVHATLFSMPNYCLHLKVTEYVCVVINIAVYLGQVTSGTCSSLMQV